MNKPALTAQDTAYGWRVIDSDGGVWWPDDQTAAEIEDSDNPESTALRICNDAPNRGRWAD